MTPFVRTCIALSWLIGISGPLCRAEATADADFFENKVRPLLVEQCYKCHSAKAEKLKGELYLDSKDGVLKGGENGVILVPGNPEKSRLVQAIRWADKDLRMPPKQKLSDQQISDLTEWVKRGAPDPRTEKPKAGGPDFAAARASWAFSVPKEHPVPQVKAQDWCKSPIDNFILAKLEEKGLKPAPPADKRTLIRRAYFDLIGLPPKPEEVDAFLSDNAPDAFAKVVDRLLASPHYGERWARHWLDVVRYTDSFDARGFGNEGDCVLAWRYRDWVVKSFNQDLPYDQFVMNQIAGDLLPAPHPNEFNADGVVATCMYVIGNWPGGEADREKMMTDLADDQIDVTGRAFLGVTLACARCHDHKFDPITTRDYYGLAGIFFSTHFLPNPGSKTSGVGLLKIPLVSPAEAERRKQYEVNVAALQKQLDQFTDSQYVANARSFLPQTDQYLAAAREFTLRPAGASGTSLEQFAADKKLDPYFLARWVEYIKPLKNSEPIRKLLAKAMHSVDGTPGVDGWNCADGRSCPNMRVNSTDHPITLKTLTLPAKSLAIHPGPTTGVAVGWTSPIAGKVQIRGRVIDADPNCGDGIDWRIEWCRVASVEALAAGAFPNGGSQAFADVDSAKRLNDVEVKPGDIVQLTVFPKAEYSCDTTIVELEITEQGGQQRVWNLTRDIVPGALIGDKGNPHPDGLGNANVWQFFETGEEGAPGATSPGSALQRWVAATDPAQIEKAAADVRDGLLALDAKGAAPAGPDAKLYQDLTTPLGPFWATARKEISHLPPEVKAAVAKMSDGLVELKKNAPPPVEQAQGLIEGGVPQSEYEGIHDSYILIRGRYDRKAEKVSRSFPRLLAGDNQPTELKGSGRLELAKWIASPQNPMTAKVMANRIWQHHFEEGIVRTPNNYGKLGIPPTHPELLDYLALRFVQNGWSIKAMHRMIMLSSAYQQSSEADPATQKADPDNSLFGHMNRHRLEAEPLRDALLAVTGTLDETMGGPAFKEMTVPRRTLYLVTIRSDRSNYRMLFDAADPTAIIDRRTDSTVAPQALFLMNDPFVLDRAKVLADRLAKQAPADDRGRIDWLYKLLYSRPPTANEAEIGIASLESARKPQGGAAPANDAIWLEYCQVLLCANEFAFID